MDVLPTLCDLAGIDIPEILDGKSFKSVLEGDENIIREVMFGVYSGGTTPGIRAVKKGKWKLVKWDVLDGKVRETQLFNLEENPEEFLIEHHDPAVYGLTGIKPEPNQVDLAEDPEYDDVRKEMEELLLEQMKFWRDPYRLWDQPGKEVH
jgi:arylsulfatase A-like enzyme